MRLANNLVGVIPFQSDLIVVSNDTANIIYNASDAGYMIKRNLKCYFSKMKRLL